MELSLTLAIEVPNSHENVPEQRIKCIVSALLQRKRERVKSRLVMDGNEEMVMGYLIFVVTQTRFGFSFVHIRKDCGSTSSKLQAVKWGTTAGNNWEGRLNIWHEDIWANFVLFWD